MYVRRGFSGLGATSSVQQMIVDAANQYGVPPSVALAIAQHESGFNPSAVNSTLNPNGTIDYGLFQLNTSVLQTYGLTPAQAMDPQTNINTAVGLLGKYIAQYGDVNTALWAYASGAGTVAAGGTPNATAIGLQNYVSSYVPPAGLDLGTGTMAIDPSTGLPVDTTVDASGTIDPTLLIGGALLAGLLLYQLV